MLSIVVFDSVDYKKTHPDYPAKKMFRFGTVWKFNENGKVERDSNILVNANNKSLQKDFELQKGRIYLLKYSRLEDGEFKFPSIINKCSIVEYSSQTSEFKIFSPGICRGASITKDYFNKERAINQVLKSEFKHHNICSFTKYMLMVISQKGVDGVELNLDNKIPQLKSFDKELYISKELSKYFAKPKEKVKVAARVGEQRIQMSLDFEDLENGYITNKDGKKDFSLMDIAGIGKKLNEEKKKRELKATKVVSEVSEKSKTNKKQEKVRKNKVYTKKDADFIINNRHLMTADEMSEAMGVGYMSLSKKMLRMIEAGVMSDRRCIKKSSRDVSTAYRNALAKQLVEFRKERGLSQAEVADILDLSQTYVSHCEIGRKTLSDENYQKIRYFIKNYDKMNDIIEVKPKKKANNPVEKIVEKNVEEIVGTETLAVEKKAAEHVAVEEVEEHDYRQGFWSKAEEDFLKKNYHKKGRRYCAEQLNRKESSVQKKINNLNLKRDFGRDTEMDSIDKKMYQELVDMNKNLVSMNKDLIEKNNELIKENKSSRKSFWSRIFNK